MPGPLFLTGRHTCEFWPPEWRQRYKASYIEAYRMRTESIEAPFCERTSGRHQTEELIAL